jgi:hypothetical protein
MALKDLKKGTHSIYGEKLDWTLYDTAILASTTTEYKFFQLAEGQGATPKTQNQTNMTSSAQIPTGQRLRTARIKVWYHAGASLIAAQTPEANLKHIYNFIHNSVVRVLIPGKDSILTMTLQELMGVSVLFPIVPTATYNVPIIQPYFHGIFPLNKKIILAEQTNFTVELKAYASNPNAALNGDTVRIGLNGLLERRS